MTTATVPIPTSSACRAHALSDSGGPFDLALGARA